MKTYLPLILSLFLLNSSYGQMWNKIELNTDEHLYGIQFVDDEKGFIIGSNGLLLRTEDGGSTWMPLDVGVTHDLMAISFLNSEVGYINGLKTVDGGETWSAQPFSEIFGMIYCIDEDNIIAGHYDDFGGDIYKSEDGGESWTIYSNPITNSTNGGSGMYNDCFFVDENLGYLSAWYSGHLFKTTDAGTTWNQILIDEVDGMSWGSDDFRSVYFASEEIGLVTHERGVLKTEDAGNTWSELLVGVSDPNFYPESIVALSSEHYIVAGGFPNNEIPKIYETKNGGDSWTVSANIIDGLFDLRCTITDCFAVGTNGAVYRKGITTMAKETSTKEAKVIIYPNPTKDFLNLKHDAEIQEIKIYTMDGMNIHEYSGAQNRIDVSHLNPGPYLVSCKTDISTVVSRFIKE